MGITEYGIYYTHDTMVSGCPFIFLVFGLELELTVPSYRDSPNLERRNILRINASLHFLST